LYWNTGKAGKLGFARARKMMFNPHTPHFAKRGWNIMKTKGTGLKRAKKSDKKARSG
jgi:hypothetical protein